MDRFTHFLLRITGTDPASLPDGAETELMLSHAPRSWQVFVVLAVAVAMVAMVVLLYRREAARINRGPRFLLTALRILSLLAIGAILLGPSVGVSLRKTVDPFVLVLVDDSLSMSMADAYRDDEARRAVETFTGETVDQLRARSLRRIDLVNDLFARDDGAFTVALSANGQVQVMSFADRVRLREAMGAAPLDALPGTAAFERGGPVPPLSAEGPATDIGRSVRGAVESVAGNRISGVILITDGRDTLNPDAMGLASELAGANIPVFTVPIGDPSEPRNIRVTEWWAPESVPPEDPFELQAQIQARNPEGGSIDVELVIRAPDADPDSGRVLERRTVALPEGSDVVSVSFTHRPEAAGTYIYEVRAPVQEGEILAADNRRDVQVKVLDQKLRILLISGGPTWDYRMVRNLLSRDKTVNLSCWLQSMPSNLRQDGDTSITELPGTPEALFEYDGIIFMDPDPLGLDPSWVELVKTFTGKHGGGILWQAGPKYTAQFLQSTNGAGVREVIPVRVIDGAGGLNIGARQTWTKEWPLRLRGAGADHPMLALDRDTKLNAKLWERMPGVFWSMRIEGAKPGAAVLLEHSDPALAGGDHGMPLMVTGRYGPGRVIYIGFNDTFRWRQRGEEIFDRFWVQAVREIAAGRLMRGRNRGQVTTERDRYGVGDRVQISARLYDHNYDALDVPEVKAEVLSATGEPQAVRLVAVPGSDGVFEGTVTARYLGRNTVVLDLDQAQDASEAISHDFVIEIANAEFAEPQLNRVYLTQLSQQTGGRVVPLDEAHRLAEFLPNRRETLVVRAKPIPLWDNSVVLIVLVLLLGLEWAIRKRLHLI